eukprot:Nk52_evm18s32 gene=Nk52_evmTU18s32
MTCIMSSSQSTAAPTSSSPSWNSSQVPLFENFSKFYAFNDPGRLTYTTLYKNVEMFPTRGTTGISKSESEQSLDKCDSGDECEYDSPAAAAARVRFLESVFANPFSMFETCCKNNTSANMTDVHPLRFEIKKAYGEIYDIALPWADICLGPPDTEEIELIISRMTKRPISMEYLNAEMSFMHSSSDVVSFLLYRRATFSHWGCAKRHLFLLKDYVEETIERRSVGMYLQLTKEALMNRKYNDCTESKYVRPAVEACYGLYLIATRGYGVDMYGKWVKMNKRQSCKAAFHLLELCVVQSAHPLYSLKLAECYYHGRGVRKSLQVARRIWPRIDAYVASGDEAFEVGLFCVAMFVEMKRFYQMDGVGVGGCNVFGLWSEAASRCQQACSALDSWVKYYMEDVISPTNSHLGAMAKFVLGKCVLLELFYDSPRSNAIKFFKRSYDTVKSDNALAYFLYCELNGWRLSDQRLKGPTDTERTMRKLLSCADKVKKKQQKAGDLKNKCVEEIQACLLMVARTRDDVESRYKTLLDNLVERHKGALGALTSQHEEKLRELQNSKKREYENLERQTICVVCLSSERTVLLQNCSHFVLCKSCSQQISECPVCRKAVCPESILDVYVS